MRVVPALFSRCVLIALAAQVFASPDQPVVESLEVMKSYAAAGDPTAQYNMGIRYTSGQEVPRDPNEGIAWYKKAAQAGFAPAQFNLGVIYSNGVLVMRDDKEAVKWLTLAAQQGTFEAQKILIEFYIEGRGVVKNPAAAMTWDFIARRTLLLRHEQPAGEVPHPPVIRKDGSAEIVAKDGTKKIIHPGGGQETIGPDGTRFIAFKDGTSKTIKPDGTETTNFQGGFSETKYPDGRKSKRDPKGTVETTYPDGRKDLEGDATDKYGRPSRVTENLDKDGKRIARIIRRGKVTIFENEKGPIRMETELLDKAGVRVKLTEQVMESGKIGQGKLTRVDNGAEPKGTEIWTIQREIEPGDGTSLLVEEDYYSLGMSNQRLISKKTIQAIFAVSTPVPPYPPNKTTFAPPQTVEVKTWEPRTFGRGAQVNVFKEKVPIEPMLKELEDLEMKAIHFAGATEADWSKANIAAAAYMIPLGSVPQKPGVWPSTFTAKLISGSTFPVFPFTPMKDDFSKEYPFGLHGRDIIGGYPWKHAETPHFIVHYIEDADARLSMQFIEGAYTVITNLLGLDPQRGTQKGHVFLFANEGEWQNYLRRTNNSLRLGGFAYKNELLLPAVSERAGREESIHTLCHEVTHAIIARFYPGARPPLWLNEGFAEYIAARTIAIKRGHLVDKYMSDIADRPMNVDEVFRRVRYGLSEPQTSVSVGGPGVRTNYNSDPILAFYANSAWCVRTLCEKLPPDGFPKFFNALSAGNSPDASLRAAFGVKCPDVKALTALVNSIEMPKPDKKKK